MGSPLYLQGQLWGPHHLSLGVWGWGTQPAHQLVVKQAGQRLRLIRAFANKHPQTPRGLTCRPRLLPLPDSKQSEAETLQAMEAKWVACMQASSQGTRPFSVAGGPCQPQEYQLHRPYETVGTAPHRSCSRWCASMDASWRSSLLHHSVVPTLTKCIQLCLLVFFITLFHGPPRSGMICLLDIAWLGHSALPVAEVRMLDTRIACT